MPINFKNVNLESVLFNNSEIETVVCDNVTVFEKSTDATVFNVTKITSNVYANSTSYTDCTFVGFKVLAGSNGATVKYGGVTKTVAANTETAVTFGTYAGAIDDGTPTTGNVSILGATKISCFTFNSAKNTTAYCNCINQIVNWGLFTTIGSYLFTNSQITTANIPNTITAIETYAFKGCANLTTVYIPNTITAIAHGVFYECTSLTNVTIQEGFVGTNDMSSMFYGCSSLVGRFNLPNSLQYISSGMFVGTGITSINSNTNGLVDLRGLTNLVSIQYNLMISTLTKLYLPTSIRVLNLGSCVDKAINGDSTTVWDLRNLVNLQQVNVPNSTTVQRIFAPTSIQIGDDSFYQCTALTTFNSTTEGTCNLTGITSFSTSDSNIWGAFAQTAVQRAVFDNSITFIPMYIFNNCTQLLETNIPAAITRIKHSAFQHTGITSITIPNATTYIEPRAFLNSQLTSAVFENKTGWQYNENQGHSSEESWVNTSVTNATTNARNLRYSESGGTYLGYGNFDWRRV